VIPQKNIDLDKMLADETRERFWPKVNMSNECWEWSAGKMKDGYGRFSMGSKTFPAHRISYAIHYGIDPGDMLVLHACDNPSCCRPSHLFLGEPTDNMADMFNKGRNADRNGELGVNASLTNAEVRLIREEYAGGVVTVVSLANRYNVPRLTIQKVVGGIIYRTAGGPITKGRRRSTTGERNGRAKLDSNKVRFLRELHAKGRTALSLSREFCIPESTVSNAVLGKTWNSIS